MSISERLKKVLEAQNLTITDAAARCGMPYRSLQNYLRGEREPKAEALVAIGTQLSISIDWLLTGRGSMSVDLEKNDHSLTESSNDDTNPLARKWLEMFVNLDEEGQKNILQDISREQQQTELRQQLKRMEETIERLNRAG
ncbi:TPA: helix-turn-helix domain-containing protein [Salmonella enterica subsp. diarizonae serovar 61:l,v:z35]|nr:helix-turn-helix domain-containing protein [Salmonella enterica subsp. enterica serovar Newport]